MRKYPRIEIDQKAYDGLQIEAVLQHRPVREIATEAILGQISREALSVLDHKTIGPKTTMPEDIATKRPLDHKTIEETCRAEGETVICDTPAQMWGTSGVPRSRKRIADDKAALDHIKARIAQGASAKDLELEMAGRPNSAVREIVKKLKEETRPPKVLTM